MEYAVMPLEDYRAIAEELREWTGSDDRIKSGEAASLIGKVYKAGQLSVLRSSEALRGEAVGSPIKADDISPTEHEVDIRLESKNLIKYPYGYGTAEMNGVTFTDNGDGTVTADGTVRGTDGEVIYRLRKGFVLPKGSYTLSGCPAGGGDESYRLTYTGEDDEEWYDSGSGRLIETSAECRGDISIRIKEGVTVTSLLFKPQLERGEVKTEYSRYIENFDSVVVTRYGKNLIPYPYARTFTAEQNGLRAVINEDASITVNGEASADTIFIFASNSNYIIKKGTYTLSGCPAGGSTGTYFLALGWSGIADTGQGVTQTYSEALAQNIFIRICAGYKAENLTFKPQLEVGEGMSEYEGYIEPEEYRSSSSGAVGGITSLHPSMTLFTDSDGAVIVAKYIKDIDKAVGK